MELNKRAKKYLEVGNIDKAREEIKYSLNIEHRNKWEEEQKVKYLKLFPIYRPMTEEEYYKEVKNFEATERVLREDLKDTPNKKIDYSNNPRFKSLQEWILEQDYIPLTELELEKRISEFLFKEYIPLRKNAYPDLGELPDALTKDWDNMPNDFKKLFSNLGTYLEKCKEVKKMYPKEVKSA
ncbi:MAG: hypothetical protein OIF32_02675 [Campylobacterales bacterium]|nr:hypothetical protein [Campylobacterales bacterium]